MTNSPVASISDEQLADIERRDLEVIAEFPDMDVSAERVRAAIVAKLRALEVLLYGAEERSLKLLEAKDHWADRAREAEKDAARYRFLMSEEVQNGTLGIGGGWIDFEDKQEAQKSIDKAMEQHP